MARGLKFLNSRVKGLYYVCSEKKGPDQLHGYQLQVADLRLFVFAYLKSKFFHDSALSIIDEDSHGWIRLPLNPQCCSGLAPCLV